MSSESLETTNLSSASNWTDDESFWYRHELPVSVLLCIAYGLVFVFGLIGNLLVTVAVLRSKRTHQCVTDLFLVNLALADLLVVLVCLPFTLVTNLIYPWIFGPVICKLIPYLQGVSVGASVYTLVVVAVERCYSICFPWKQRLSPSSCRKIIVLIWIAAGVITLPWTVVFQLHQAGQYKICTDVWPSPVMGDIYFIVTNMTLCYVVPLFIIVLSYGFVWKQLWNRQIPCEIVSERQLEIQNGTGPTPQNVQLQRSKVRALRMLLAVVVAFTLAWFPLYLTFGMLKLGPHLSDDQLEVWKNVVPIAQWLSSSNSCVNPILYHFLDRRLRAMFRKKLLCFRRSSADKLERRLRRTVQMKLGSQQQRDDTTWV